MKPMIRSAWRQFHLNLIILIAAVICFQPSSLYGSNLDQSRSHYQNVLETFVKADGNSVDYTALKKEPENLMEYLESTRAISQEEFDGWSEDEQKAFLINVYNAETLKLIIEHYPVKSIRNIGWFTLGPWNKKIIPLLGEKVSLNHIEHTLLRRKYEDPNIHFALVCASLGCPSLKKEPFTGPNLDKQLEEQRQIFLSDKTKNFINQKNKIIHLSPIFKWFGRDFIRESGSVVNFMKEYFPKEQVLDANLESFEIEYTDYDWSLNDVKA